MLFDFDDLLIEPAIHTEINSRSQVDPYDRMQMLPLFTAPMDTVISSENSKLFRDQKIYTISPRRNYYHSDHISSDPHHWVSYGLEDFKNLFISKMVHGSSKIYALIDIANGHMNDLLETIKMAKMIYGNDMVLMVGNCAHPLTYFSLSRAGADYVRIGIGNGQVCLTTVQTGVGYPMASLISECSKIQIENNLESMIVADGGFKKYSDIIKGLALGADYIMVGMILNKALESSGDTFEANKKYNSWTEPGEKVDQYSDEIKNQYLNGKEFYKKFRGMSIKEVQKIIGKSEIKTSEGISRMHKVEYTLSGWTENFTDYLKSAMSYTDCRTIGEFIGKVNYNIISQKSSERFNK